MLDWSRARYGDGEVATSARWPGLAYVLAGKPGEVTLTRYERSYSGPGRYGREADTDLTAIQAARNAIPIHPMAGSGALGSDLAVGRKIAQDFEDGEDIFGHPYWQQGG